MNKHFWIELNWIYDTDVIPLKMGSVVCVPQIILTYCGPVTPYNDIDQDCSLPDGNITWTDVDFSSMRFCGIHHKAISQWLPNLLFCIKSLKIIVSKLLPHLPGANELSKFSRLIFHKCTWYLCPFSKNLYSFTNAPSKALVNLKI